VPTVYSSSYVPTSYVYPTIYDYPIATVASASPCDGVAAVRSAAPPVRSESVREPSSAVDRSREEAAPPRYEEPPRPLESEPRTAPAPAPEPAPPQDEVPQNPGPPPAETKTTLPPPSAGAADANSPPVAPSGDAGFPPIPNSPAGGPNPGDKAPYQVRRPVYGAVPQAIRNVLSGRVVSGETGDLEPGVEVIVSSQTHAFRDRVTTTNAQGRYSLRVPDGDWTVSVVMPSGRAYPVSQITISGGEISDDLGRRVPSLKITR
jgi:hypothetical protein